jgi:sulfite exporter TauE/SafE
MDHHHSEHLHLLMGISPLEFGGFISILSYSFFASLHCAFMCSPLVCAVIGNQCRPDRPGIWLYNFGRIISYVGAGALLGSLGAGFTFLNGSFSRYFSVIAGMIIILMAIRPWIKISANGPAVRPTARFPDRLSKFIATKPVQLRSWLLGIGTVILPCMTLTPALTMALGSGGALSGGVLMLGFLLGTLPMMLLSPAVAQGILDQIKGRLGEMIATGFLLVAGLITILRAFH